MRTTYRRIRWGTPVVRRVRQRVAGHGRALMGRWACVAAPSMLGRMAACMPVSGRRMEDEVHLLVSVFRPKVHGDHKEGGIYLSARSKSAVSLWVGGVDGSLEETYSTSTTLLSFVLTIIFATVAGAMGRRSCD